MGAQVVCSALWWVPELDLDDNIRVPTRERLLRKVCM